MNKLAKEAAEMYAVGCISQSQVKEYCSSESEYTEALAYAKDYGEEYAKWLVSQQNILG